MQWTRERYLTYTAAKKQSREFAPRVAQALKNNRIEEAINISDKHRKSHLAMVVMVRPWSTPAAATISSRAAASSAARRST